MKVRDPAPGASLKHEYLTSVFASVTPVDPSSGLQFLGNYRERLIGLQTDCQVNDWLSKETGNR